MQIYPVLANDMMGTISIFKKSRWLWHLKAIYLTVTPTLILLNSQSQQNAADTMPLQHPFCRTLCLLQNLLKVLTIGANQNTAFVAVVSVISPDLICHFQFKTL